MFFFLRTPIFSARVLYDETKGVKFCRVLGTFQVFDLKRPRFGPSRLGGVGGESCGGDGSCKTSCLTAMYRRASQPFLSGRSVIRPTRLG